MSTITSLGVMSGTSLDGVDLAICRFNEDNGKWTYQILDAKTVQYSSEWKKILSHIHYDTSAFEFLKVDQEYGIYLANLIGQFLTETGIKVDIIASHGHTVFHQPVKGITCQIGDGNTIAARTGIATVTNFRSMDVALGGQGAPLVPIGDLLLFEQYSHCLNLGGFANISVKNGSDIYAFDICPVNIVINPLASDLGYEYDESGELGRKGKINLHLLKALNALDFYAGSGPKSLGKEWLDDHLMPIIYRYDISVEDKLRTLYEHISGQIAKTINIKSAKELLITGGGAFNRFLLELIEDQLKVKLELPPEVLIHFKEAMVFALLGTLRIRNQRNIMAKVTGASRDCIGGGAYSGY